ncbi:hypothetical protein BX667DRAFT_466871, partial [Coemansia mojavensis]
LVVAYFQRGVSYMVRQKNAEALADFNSALKYLRDNEFIDYTQIGLDYKVYTCEVMYNRALCFFCLGQEEDAQADLADASKRVAEERHSWIKRAIASNGMDCPLYCVPKGIIYRPSASKLKSTQKIDFLGSAKVIASADGKDNFTGFKGALVRKETLKSQGMSGGISHQKSMRSSTSPMMTPPLSYEEMAARGIAGISISQKPAVNAYGTSSSATISPSPASPAPGSHQYGSLNGAVAGGLRRAPTKKDSMKVKVHYNEAIINLMVPKMASYETLRAKISAKLASAMDEEQPSRSALRIQYLDEDGEAVLMTDEDDFELAKAYAGGDMSTPETNVVERLELWCST